MLTFVFRETDGHGRSAEPVGFGLASGRGELEPAASWRVTDRATGGAVPAAVRIDATWPDGTVRWLFVECAVTLDAGESRTYVLAPDRSADTHGAEGRRSRRAESPVVRAELGKPGLDLVEVGGTGPSVSVGVYLVDADGVRHVAAVRSVRDASGTGFRRGAAIALEVPALGDGHDLAIDLRIDAFPASGLVEMELCPHNRAAARHPAGLWDLGDPASVRFRELGLEIRAPGATATRLTLLDAASGPRSFDVDATLELEQLSSGGDGGDGAVHVGADGRVPALPEGFELRVDGLAGHSGARATPLLRLAVGEVALELHPERFWQEFPSALRVADGVATVALFAATPAGDHELQPGERKRRRVSLRASDGRLDSPWLAHRLAPPARPHESAPDAVMLRALECRDPVEAALLSLVLSPEEFLAKRELIDEYGWRNFGDVFADHESLYRAPGEPWLVSHYNNQYDLVLGFGLQFLRTGDPAWFALMEDLARHVVDIDVYHTDRDRVEFNHGLFWHTNHYEPAATATHRTFSIANYDPDNPIGSSGGPAEEHCYTSGLLLHHRLTGDERSAEAVLGLAAWVQSVWLGDRTVLGRLRAIADFELRVVMRLLRRRRARPHFYNVRRGTGNLLVAQLDAFELSGDRTWLGRAETVLTEAFHPDDDIGARGLGNAERGWSYTVFLQAVLRFLAAKEELGEIDVAYAHARRGFLAYARWMLDNERPYLETPERLEYPNDTWAAQDIRRHGLLLAAAAYDPENARRWRDGARVFGEHALARLSASDTAHFARIQALLLWNLGIGTRFSDPSHAPPADPTELVVPPLKRPTVGSALGGALRKLGGALVTLDLGAELRWWRTRRSGGSGATSDPDRPLTPGADGR